jgi:hypothetical protein
LLFLQFFLLPLKGAELGIAHLFFLLEVGE